MNCLPLHVVIATALSSLHQGHEGFFVAQAGRLARAIQPIENCLALLSERPSLNGAQIGSERGAPVRQQRLLLVLRLLA